MLVADDLHGHRTSPITVRMLMHRFRSCKTIGNLGGNLFLFCIPLLLVFLPTTWQVISYSASPSLSAACEIASAGDVGWVERGRGVETPFLALRNFTLQRASTNAAHHRSGGMLHLAVAADPAIHVEVGWVQQPPTVVLHAG